MVDNRTNFTKDISTLLRDTYGSKVKVFATDIPHSVRAAEISAEGKCTLEAMCAIMSEEKKSEVDKVTLTSDKLSKYFPKSHTPQKMKETFL